MGSTLHTDSSPAGVVRPSLQSACKCCDKALNEAHTALTALSADSLLSLQLWAGGGLSYYKESLSLVGLPMIVIKVINIDLPQWPETDTELEMFSFSLFSSSPRCDSQKRFDFYEIH